MRILVQRVNSAKVIVDNNEITHINDGLLLFVGVGKDDDVKDIDHMVKKVVNLRIFKDGHNKMNLNVKQIKGEILSVPQFTLYADTLKGNRPGFELSATPEVAKGYWEKFNNLLRENDIEVKEGIFGAYMEVELTNDGPVTIWLDSKQK